jgi:hypothetical protein
MANLNRVLLIGNCTRDPDQRFTPKGTAVTEISLAINRVFKGENDEKKGGGHICRRDALGTSGRDSRSVPKERKTRLHRGSPTTRLMGRQADRPEEVTLARCRREYPVAWLPPRRRKFVPYSFTGTCRTGSSPDGSSPTGSHKSAGSGFGRRARRYTLLNKTAARGYVQPTIPWRFTCLCWNIPDGRKNGLTLRNR